MIDWYLFHSIYLKSFLILGANVNQSIPEEIYEQQDSKKEIHINDSEANSGATLDIGPTVLFCNPNAGYYEYMYYEVAMQEGG